MSAPALPLSLHEAIRCNDLVPAEIRGAQGTQLFLDSLLELVPPLTSSLTVAQSEHLEAAYQAGAKCLDDAGLLLVVPRDVLLALMARGATT